MSETDDVLSNTESLLARAAEIDPVAWTCPLPRRTESRRTRSYAQAVKEFKNNAIAN